MLTTNNVDSHVTKNSNNFFFQCTMCLFNPSRWTYITVVPVFSDPRDQRTAAVCKHLFKIVHYTHCLFNKTLYISFDRSLWWHLLHQDNIVLAAGLTFEDGYYCTSPIYVHTMLAYFQSKISLRFDLSLRHERRQLSHFCQTTLSLCCWHIPIIACTFFIWEEM